MITTKAALHFFDPQVLPVKCMTDSDEWVSCLFLELFVSVLIEVYTISVIFSMTKNACSDA